MIQHTFGCSCHSEGSPSTRRLLKVSKFVLVFEFKFLLVSSFWYNCAGISCYKKEWNSKFPVLVELIPYSCFFLLTEAGFGSLCDHLHIPIGLILARLLCALCSNPETYHHGYKQDKYPYAIRFVCTLQVHFLLLPFPAVSFTVLH